MASTQSTIPTVPAQRYLFVDADPKSDLAASRRRVIETMQDAVRALNAEIVRLESTGNFDETEIDRSYDRLTRAVEWFEEERLTDELDAKLKRGHRRGYIREVA